MRSVLIFIVLLKREHLYIEIEYECMRVCAVEDVELKSVIVFMTIFYA